MSKLLTTPIVKKDIEEYLKDYSDFSFEIRVLKKLKDLGLDCRHSGIYDDPITKKGREFDIRALYVAGKSQLSVDLSVECKNICDFFPLVLHCLKRDENESYNELIHTYNPKRKYEHLDHMSYDDMSGQVNIDMFNTLEKSESIRVEGDLTLYPEGAYVAKSADQVGRVNDKKQEIKASDGMVFEKINQAISSANELIFESHELDTDETDYLTFICPVLVIPDGVLWQVNYDKEGDPDGDPEMVNHLSYYFGKKWTVGSIINLTYEISHLEIITFSEIENFIIKYLNNYVELIEENIDDVFNN